MSVVEKAAIFAAQKHQGGIRKGTTLPYIVHPMEAAAIASSLTDDKEIIAAALLHDVIEDTGVTKDELSYYFGKRIADIVANESENKRVNQKPEDTWGIRKQETIDRVTKTDDMAVKIVALSDKLANLRAIYKDKETIGDKVWERFNAKDEKKHKWYYTSMADATKELADTVAWKEYNRLLKETFKDT